MPKINDYPAATELNSSDLFLVDGSNGTRKITVADNVYAMYNNGAAEQHRNIYRGKNLGTSITSAQKAAIGDGTFDDLYIGDYWTLNGTRYNIADINYYYNTGSTYNFNKNHLVMVPNANMYSAQMNSSNIVDGAYVGSEMYTTNIEDARNTISEAFGSMLATHEIYLENAVTDGAASAGAWIDTTVDLMDEVMVYGCRMRTKMDSNNRYLALVEKQQLALFRLYPRQVNIRAAYWLRNVYSSTSFCYVTGRGDAGNNSASNSIGVRPAFCITNT